MAPIYYGVGELDRLYTHIGKYVLRTDMLRKCPMTPQPQEKRWIVTDRQMQLLTVIAKQMKNMLPSSYDLLAEMLCEAEPYDTRTSHPAPSPRIDVSKCFEDIVYSSSPWKIYRQDAGMGEHDYAVFLDDVFYCRTEDSQTAMRIVNTMRRTGGEPR